MERGWWRISGNIFLYSNKNWETWEENSPYPYLYSPILPMMIGILADIVPSREDKLKDSILGMGEKMMKRTGSLMILEGHVHKYGMLTSKLLISEVIKYLDYKSLLLWCFCDLLWIVLVTDIGLRKNIPLIFILSIWNSSKDSSFFSFS